MLSIGLNWLVVAPARPACSRKEDAVYDRKANNACSDDGGSLSIEVPGLVDALLEALCELVPSSVVCR
jgi:hypothetical protein